MEDKIKLDKILNIAQIGINRALVFIGLGINGASVDTIDFEVLGVSYFKLFKNEVRPDDLQKFKDEFKIWIVGKGLEELIETFAFFLEQLYSIVLYIDEWKTQIKASQKKQYIFNQKGIEDKLNDLEKFGIKTAFKNDIISVHKARNCLTHRLGIVDKKDLNSTDKLKIQWHTPQLYGYNEDCTEFIPNMDLFGKEQINKSPVIFPKGSPVNMRNDLKSKAFSVGSHILFEPHELKEICLWFALLVNEFKGSIVDYAKISGATINETPKKLMIKI